MAKVPVEKVPAAKTAAERQAAYKARADENGDRRLDTWVSAETMLALERIARYHSKTKREIVEALVRQQDAKLTRSLEPAKGQAKRTTGR